MKNARVYATTGAIFSLASYLMDLWFSRGTEIREDVFVWTVVACVIFAISKKETVGFPHFLFGISLTLPALAFCFLVSWLFRSYPMIVSVIVTLVLGAVLGVVASVIDTSTEPNLEE